MGVRHSVKAVFDNGTLECAKCGVVEAAYKKCPGDKIRAVCVVARREQRDSPRRRPHGLSGKARREYLEGKVCEICGTSESLVVDHCHDTLVIRGALCIKCNVGIGMFRDDPALAENALAYLSRFN